MDSLSRWLTVKEAAEIWSLTEDAVRKRIKRGTIQATQQDGVWRVLVEESALPKTPQDIAAEQERQELAAAVARAEREAEDLRGKVAAVEAQAEAMRRQLDEAANQKAHAAEVAGTLREEVQRLTEQNAAMWTEFARVNTMMDRQTAILERVLSLPAQAGPSAGVPDQAEPRRQADDADKPLSFWQRIFGRRE